MRCGLRNDRYGLRQDDFRVRYALVFGIVLVGTLLGLQLVISWPTWVKALIGVLVAYPGANLYQMESIRREIIRSQDAVAAYLSELARDPADVDAHYNLGVIYAALGVYAETGVGRWQSALRYWGGRVPTPTEYYELAAFQFEQAITLDPVDAQASANLATMYWLLGRSMEASQAAAKAVDLAPSLARKLARLLRDVPAADDR